MLTLSKIQCMKKTGEAILESRKDIKEDLEILPNIRSSILSSSDSHALQFGKKKIKNPTLSTYISAEMHSVIAVDLVRAILKHRINDELVVSPLEVRGFLEVTPTFLIHSDSFTLQDAHGIKGIY